MRKLFSVCGLVAVLATALIAVSAPVSAASGTYNVTNKSDANTPGSLRNAIIQASTAGAGTQTVNIKVSGEINVGSALNFSGTGHLIINGNGVTLDGLNNSRVFQSSNPASTTTLRNLTIERGKTSSQGGGILNYGRMTLDRVTVRQSSAERGGGGILHGAGTLTVLRSKITGNVARNTDTGGGLNNPNGAGILAPSGLVEIDQSLIANNRADRDGGGVLAARVAIKNSTIVNNRAGYGQSGKGGLGWGGGVRISSTAGSSIRFSTFSGNRTQPWNLKNGGAGANLYGGGDNTKLTFHANVLTNPKGSPNCAGMSTNSSTVNPRVYSRFNYTHQNGSMGVNLGGHGGETFCGPNHKSDTLSGNPADDPKLGSLQNNGGPTSTMMPTAASPLVDAIKKNSINCPSNDQRGASYPRPSGTSGRCDIGAVERRVKATPPPPPPPSSSKSKFVPLPPKRIFDTRSANPSGKLGRGAEIDVQIRGAAGVPNGSSVTAVVLNVTATEATAQGYVTVFPDGTARPNASNLNLMRAGQTAPNLVTVPIGANGKVSFYSQNGTHLLADVAGYYVKASKSTSGRFMALSPSRLFDTRTPAAPSGFVQRGASITVDVNNKAGLPASGISAVALNLTADQAANDGYITAYPSNVSRPNASTLNLDGPGHTAANMAIVPVSPDGKITFYSHAGAHLIGDVFGYFTDGTASSSASGLFTPLTPSRIFDTRSAPAPTGFVGRGSSVSVATTGTAGIPNGGVGAVFLNVTASEAAAPGYVTVYPTGQSQPGSSNLNLTQVGETRPNAAIIKITQSGKLSYFTQNGAHLISDASGYFSS